MLVERIATGSETEARQVEFPAVKAACPQPPHLDAPPSERDRARCAAGPLRGAGSIVAVLGAAQRRAVMLHHRFEHLAASLDTQPEEGAASVGQHGSNLGRNLYAERPRHGRGLDTG